MLPQFCQRINCLSIVVALIGQSIPMFSTWANADDVRPIATADQVEISLNRLPPGNARLVERLPDVAVDSPLLPAELSVAVPVEGDSITLPRFADGYDRLLSRWLLIDSDNKPLSNEIWTHCASSASRFANLPALSAKSPKGMGGLALDPALLPDLADIGVHHVTVNVVPNQFFVAGKQAANTATCEHHYAGKTYAFRQSMVDSFQQACDFFAENNIVASFIILIPRNASPSSPARLLIHPEAVDGNYSLLNVTDMAGIQQYAAFLNFLATRFAGPQTNNQRGPVANWIIGNEVDAAWVWTNAGEKTVEQYTEQYIRALRISQAAVQAVDPHARVFVSLTHHWTSPHQQNLKRFYKGKDILDLIAVDSQTHGDYPWGLAYHPYPQSLFEARTWNDKLATDDLNTPLITFKNLDVLDRVMKRDDMLFTSLDGHQKTRGVLLSEQGFHVHTDNPDGERIQAAALIYAWQAIQRSSVIEAFHYHRWIDHEREGGLKLGLWTVDPGTIWRPKDKRLGWHVYQALGTPREPEVSGPYLELIGK